MLKRITSFFLALLFIYITTGFTVLQHVCNTAGTCDVISIDGISTEFSDGCCCTAESLPPPRENWPENHVINPSPCCIEITRFLRFEHLSIIVTGFSFLKILEFPIPSLTAQYSGQPEPGSPVNCLALPHAPPEAGMKLLISLHQIKIPAPDQPFCS